MRLGGWAVLGLVACVGGDDGTTEAPKQGDVTVVAGAGPVTLQTIDGWTLTFASFDVQIDGVAVAEPASGGVYATSAPAQVDLLADGADVATLSAPKGAVNLAFDVVPGDDATTHALAAEATDGVLTLQFDWRWADPAVVSACTGFATGDTATLSGDPSAAFRAGLDAEAPLRFAPFAVWADAGGTLSWDAIAGGQLAALQDPYGEPLRDETGVALSYDDGDRGLATLQDLVRVGIRESVGFEGSDCAIHVE